MGAKLSEVDRRQMNAWNATTRSYSSDCCIHTLIECQVAKTPSKTAVVFGAAALTYRELNQQANQVAHFLRGRGIGPDQVVGLHMGRSIEIMVALLGVLKAGAAYVPLDPQYPRDRLKHMAIDSEATVILATEGIEALLPENEVKTISFAKDCSARIWCRESLDNLSQTGRSSANLAHLLYTSGSTGRPKGVEVNHRSVVNFLEAFAEILDFSEDELVVSVTGLSFDIAGLDIYLTWMTGARLLLVPRPTVFDGDLLRKFVESSQGTFLQTTPATWRSLLDSGWKAPEGFKGLCGGESMPPQLLQDFARQPLRLWNVYGPTETTIWSTAHEFTAADYQRSGRISIGHPIANTSIYLVDENLNQVGIGEVGEVLIGGAGLARGYRNNKALTEEKFIAHQFQSEVGARLYRTGDLGCYRSNGEIELLGRKDYQIKFHGYRIEPGEIEQAIRQVAGIKDCLVILVDAAGKAAIAAYLVAPSIKPDIAANLSSLLPNYMIPKHFVALSSFPLTPNGKVDRKALPRP
ncbi:MAG: amino acid adenylation domain-containing protein [Proteobacteria bacterium]|nr:amino acid adenylation domain-containing protein [Pseudomonadota bacterium]